MSVRSICPRVSDRTLGELCARLTDERLLIGSAPIMAEVRSRLYSLVTSLWEVTKRQDAIPALRAGSSGKPRQCCARVPMTMPTATKISRKWRAASATARAGCTACSRTRLAWRPTIIASACASSAAASG